MRCISIAMSSPFFGNLPSLLRVSRCLAIWPSSACWIASCSSLDCRCNPPVRRCVAAFVPSPLRICYRRIMVAAFSMPRFRSSGPNVALYLSDVLAHASMFLAPSATSSYMRGLFSSSRPCLVFCVNNRNHGVVPSLICLHFVADLARIRAGFA